MGEVAELLQNRVELFTDGVESLCDVWIREFAGQADPVLRATRWCCAQSSRSRSILRRWVSPVARMRARAARGSVHVDYSSAVERPFSIASGSA